MEVKEELLAELLSALKGKKEEDGILLNAMETRMVNHAQKNLNEQLGNAEDLGYNIDLTALTQLVKKVSKQKHFTIRPSEYIPIRVGEGAWSDQLITYRTYDVAEGFEKGLVDLGLNHSRLHEVDTGIDSVPVKVHSWASQKAWTHIELMQAARANSWGLVEAKEESRKKFWDLGIQDVAFVGLKGHPETRGLLTQPASTSPTGEQIRINNSLVSKKISAMTSTELKDFLRDLVETYRANCERTAWPDTFAIPEDDYNGLGTVPSPDFPVNTVREIIKMSLEGYPPEMVSKFKIIPCAYGIASFSRGLGQLTNDRYALYRQDDASLRMNIPVDYTPTSASSFNNFQWQNVAYAQFTGVKAYRPRELMYFERP